MINESQQEKASLYVLGALNEFERHDFEAELHASSELRDFVHDLKHTTVALVGLVPQHQPPAKLREKILEQISARAATANIQSNFMDSMVSGLRFIKGEDDRGWKPLPVPGAWIKLLSMNPDHGYAVVLGKIEAGVHYPAHRHETAEDLMILSGDLHISGQRLGPGDFHHADAGSQHGINYSLEGCTLIAVLDVTNPLVELAQA